jgi:hypothetical protein
MRAMPSSIAAITSPSSARMRRRRLARLAGDGGWDRFVETERVGGFLLHRKPPSPASARRPRRARIVAQLSPVSSQDETSASISDRRDQTQDRHSENRASS